MTQGGTGKTDKNLHYKNNTSNLTLRQSLDTEFLASHHVPGNPYEESVKNQVSQLDFHPADIDDL